MTKDKFQTLCEQVLIPRMGDMLHAQLIDILQTLDAMAGELIRLRALLERTAAGVSRFTDDAGQR